MAFVENDPKELRLHWHLLKDSELPATVQDNDSLLRIYQGLSYKTSSQLKQDANENAKKFRIGWWVVFVWAAIVPAVVAVLEFISPVWVAVLVLIYSLYKAAIKALKLLGKWKVSDQEKKKNELDIRVRHHHYHCEHNPEGFERLKLENFERWEREAIRQEANAFKVKDKDG